jgi:Spy/CpxP family protein refolding chaperone
MKRRIVGLAAAGLAIFGIGFATTYYFARHAAQSYGPTGLYAAHNWAHEIGLSKDQEKRLDPLEQSLKKDLSAVQIKLAEDRMTLCSLMRQEPADPKEVDSYVNRVAQLEAVQQRRVVLHLLAMRDILTPQQKDKFFAAIMREICECCRAAVPGQKCLCGMHNMKVKS